jgi:hypothetical protein
LEENEESPVGGAVVSDTVVLVDVVVAAVMVEEPVIVATILTAPKENTCVLLLQSYLPKAIAAELPEPQPETPTPPPIATVCLALINCQREDLYTKG